MPHGGDLDRAFWHSRSVARSVGVSFADAMTEGRLEQQSFADLVDTCARCCHEAACAQWLGQAGGPRGADQAPDFCAISAIIDRLRPH